MDAGGLRRVVTGADADGRSAVISDARPPTVLPGRGGGDAWIAEEWVLDALPADLRDTRDLAGGRWRLTAPPGGMAFRLAQFAPAGEPGCASERHATPTLDCVVVLSGRVWLTLDDGAVELSAGDCIVQHGATHAWENRENEPCVVAAVLISAEE